MLNTPEERARRLQEMPEIHADPNMDPSHESDENDEDPEEKKHGNSACLLLSHFVLSELVSLSGMVTTYSLLI